LNFILNVLNFTTMQLVPGTVSDNPLEARNSDLRRFGSLWPLKTGVQHLATVTFQQIKHWRWSAIQPAYSTHHWQLHPSLKSSGRSVVVSRRRRRSPCKRRTENSEDESNDVLCPRAWATRSSHMRGANEH